MDLPTYTNIWRIEKRLYKLYDLRLPTPLPIVWIGVFVGVFVPWSLLLVLVGVPVEMPWHVLFLVPPGIVTWLSTRPVIEGKRLTELLESQLRYLGQPKAWYRLAPASEPETVTFAGRVWRTTPGQVKARPSRKAAQARRAAADATETAPEPRRTRGRAPKPLPRRPERVVDAAEAAGRTESIVRDATTSPRGAAVRAEPPARRDVSGSNGGRGTAGEPGATPRRIRPAVAAAAAAAAQAPVTAAVPEPPVSGAAHHTGQATGAPGQAAQAFGAPGSQASGHAAQAFGAPGAATGAPAPSSAASGHAPGSPGRPDGSAGQAAGAPGQASGKTGQGAEAIGLPGAEAAELRGTEPRQRSGSEPRSLRSVWGTVLRRGTAPALGRPPARPAAPPQRGHDLPEPSAPQPSGTDGSEGSGRDAGIREPESGAAVAGPAVPGAEPGPAVSAPAGPSVDGGPAEEQGRRTGTKQAGAGTEQAGTGTEQAGAGTEQAETGTEQGRTGTGAAGVGGEQGAAGAAAGRSAGGKPIDTEALRRLRKLAASADAPSEPLGRPADPLGRPADPLGRPAEPLGHGAEPGGRGAEPVGPGPETSGRRAEGLGRGAESGQSRGGARRDDDVARNQHRKGQPPRIGPAVTPAGVQRVWPPTAPAADRPVSQEDVRQETARAAAPAAPEVHEPGPAALPEPSAATAPEASTPGASAATALERSTPELPAATVPEVGTPGASAATVPEASTPEPSAATAPEPHTPEPLTVTAQGPSKPEGEASGGPVADPAPTGLEPEPPAKRTEAAEQAAGRGAVGQAAGRGAVGQAAGRGGVDQAAGRGAVGQAAGRGAVDQAAGRGAVDQAAGRGGVGQAAAEDTTGDVGFSGAVVRAASREPEVRAAAEVAADRAGAPDGKAVGAASGAAEGSGPAESVEQAAQETSGPMPSAATRKAAERVEATEPTQTGQRAQTGEPIKAAGMPIGPASGARPGEARVRRVESVVGRDSGGWRRIAQVVVGGGGVRSDGSEIDEARARAVFGGSRRIVVLGCTGGAGQSTTALMLGHTLARYRDDRVVAVDASTGRDTLTSKIEPETPETFTSLLSRLDRVSGYLGMRGYTTRTSSGLEVIGADTDAGAEQRLADRTLFSDHRLGESLGLLDRFYKLAVIDPAAALAARVLPYADQLVLVVPASEEASDAVAMTYEWLDGHGCAELRRRAVMVVNGVSRRSMADVEQAESVARGRCRAIVRVPWEDGLAPEGADVVDPGQLRAAGRRAYLALAGVVVAGFAAQTVRPSEEELASDPPGTRIGER
uniref:TcpE family conjugal transfer membrane protein n=1 Tax=Nonomuraea pusilla TaxID=46177 RepID=UPI0006E240A4|nr:TcpE family conjugal transfer membrane protein [Nonomuraea pusilla]